MCFKNRLTYFIAIKQFLHGGLPLNNNFGKQTLMNMKLLFTLLLGIGALLPHACSKQKPAKATINAKPPFNEFTKVTLFGPIIIKPQRTA